MRENLRIHVPILLLILGSFPIRADNETGDNYRTMGYIYLSPVPNAEYVLPETEFILVRFGPISPYDLTNLSEFISVIGEVSGTHTGQTRIAGDGRTVIFDLDVHFLEDERVTVTLTPTVEPGAGGVVVPYQYAFRISHRMQIVPLGPEGVISSESSDTGRRTESVLKPYDRFDPDRRIFPATSSETPEPLPSPPAEVYLPQILPNGVSVPSDFPRIAISVSDNPDPGLIFLDNGAWVGRHYAVIFDNSGLPVWYKYAPIEGNLDVQRNGLLTMFVVPPDSAWYFSGLDTHYRPVGRYCTVNGYTTDLHELRVLEDGRYFLIGLGNAVVDMTHYVLGGDPQAVVGETVIQEFTPAGELIFQWRAWDHFDIRDVELIDIRSHNIRFPHMNAIDIDNDGHILLSSRNLSEVTKIHRQTGEIIWRLGGAHNEFAFVNDPLNGFRNQHAIRTVGSNHYTLYDNGNLRTPQFSRGVEYELNLQNKTASLVWQYRLNPDGYANGYGNVQRLSNGNTLIAWGQFPMPKLTEVRADGTKAFEMTSVDVWDTYRVWRYPWGGHALKPYLMLEALPDSMAVMFNQFGDPNVAYYRIYGGTSPQPTTLLATSTTTLKRLTNLENGRRYYFRITAVNQEGLESEYSNEESIVVNIFGPGQNMIQNGDFSQWTASWVWSCGGTASAQWMIENGVSHFKITAGGSASTDIQLRQAGIRLMRGTDYIFEFDAWAQAPRIIEAKVEKNGSPWTNYGKIGFSYVTPQKKRFRYPFTMQDPSESDARVVLNLGTSPYDVYVDNLSLSVAVPGDFDFDGCVSPEDLAVLTNQWLNEQTGLQADLDNNGYVDLGDFAVLAEYWMKSCP
jgi:hypothetical protein